MKALVTGCAGFIGSTLTDRLLKDGFEVIGIDRFSDYYSREIKERNLNHAIKHSGFTLLEEDIVNMNTFPEVEYIFHLAAQAGVRASWGKNFDVYIRDNIQATQRLLEFYKEKKIHKFVYSSSSSVYGDSELPMREDGSVQPVSPYGVTKLAAEHLCYLYWKNYGVPTISLRYFTVYGPRQRPDMAIHKFVKAILQGESITIYGEGKQTRDFTFIDDIVESNVVAASSACEGEMFNIGGANRISVNDLVSNIEEITGNHALIRHIEEQKGDVRDTWSDARKAEKLLVWSAKTDIYEGLSRYVNWIKDMNNEKW
ncbi:MAG TPA: GDP-mannose 4,6-dehydratase [Syntrophales bacterium]|nr:GDP-mannose 4,6-dehydratase [Syntrophales bacterium]